MYLELLKTIIILSVIGFWINLILSTVGKGIISYKEASSKEFRANVKYLKDTVINITDHFFKEEKDEASK